MSALGRSETGDGHGEGVFQFAAIACGGRHSLAILTDGRVLSWGCNSNGQLGTGDKKERAWPTPVRGPWLADSIVAGGGGTAIQVAAGWRHSLALTRDRRVLEWGHAGAAAEVRIRQELRVQFDPDDPESYLEPIEQLVPRPVDIRGSEGYEAAVLRASWGTSCSTSSVLFHTQRNTSSAIRAVMERLAETADGLLGDENGDENGGQGQGQDCDRSSSGVDGVVDGVKDANARRALAGLVPISASDDASKRRRRQQEQEEDQGDDIDVTPEE